MQLVRQQKTAGFRPISKYECIVPRQSTILPSFAGSLQACAFQPMMWQSTSSFSLL